MNLHPTIPKHAAFSLVEVLCAVLLLGVGVAGLTVGITTAVRSSTDSALTTAAALFASGLVETVRAEGYVFPGEDSGSCENLLSEYGWQQSIVETSIEGLYEMSVSVNHAASGIQLYQLTTMLFDPPVYSVPDPDETGPEGSSRGANRAGGNR